MLEPKLLEISKYGHDLVVPEGTTIAEAKIMVETAAQARTQNISIDDWDYTRMLDGRFQALGLFIDVTPDNTPPLVIRDETGKEYYTCETTTDLHKHLRTLEMKTKEASNG